MPHLNNSLPPVGIEIYILHNGEPLKVIRKGWASSYSTPIEYTLVDTNEILELKNVSWSYNNWKD